jgi:hypothetical protein
MDHQTPGKQERRKQQQRVPPGGLSLADRSPTPMREKGVSFGPNQSRNFAKDQPVVMLMDPQPSFPPRPPATPGPQTPGQIVVQTPGEKGTAKQRRQQRFAALTSQGGKLPGTSWSQNWRPRFNKGKGKGKKGKNKGKQKANSGKNHE